MKPHHQMAVFGFFFFVYMLSTSREIPWNDAHLIYHTAGAIVLRGEIGVPITGAPGQYQYAPHPLLPALTQVPGWIIYNWIISKWMPAWSMAKVMTSHLAPAFCGALTCVLFLNAALVLGVGRRIASAFTLILGFSTTIWVYARSPYSEIVQAAALMGYAGALLAFWHTPRRSTAFRVGLWAALLVNSKVVFVLALPGGLLLCLFRLRHSLRRFLGLAPWAVVPLLAGGWVVLLHNRARTGEVTSTGYGEVGQVVQVLSQPLWEGAWGLLASPGKSIFLFTPALALSLWGLRQTSKHAPHLLWMLAFCLPPVFLVYAKFESWSGDWAWGPRYLIPMFPVLLLPAVVWFAASRTADAYKRAATLAVVALSLAGLWIQMLGNLFYWDHFIRISQEARNAWLGNPNRSASKGIRRPNGCDPCFEDYYPIQWLAPFQQISGHWWLLKNNIPKQKPWYEATMNAPWSRYTKAMIPIERSYIQSRIDWWVLQFSGRFKTATVILIVINSLGGLGCGTLWWLSCRRRALPKAVRT